MKRVFLIVLDSFGIGEMPDAADFGDAGSNTLASCRKSPFFSMPNMEKLGLFSIDGAKSSASNGAAAPIDSSASSYEKASPTGSTIDICEKQLPTGSTTDICEKQAPTGSYARLAERSRGKDTTTGHWEIAGLISENPMPTFPNGFPDELLREFSAQTGRGVLCNKPYSGTDVIRDYGPQQLETGDLIVYTSADSVFQIAAHEDLIPVEELYRYCEIARKLLVGDLGVGRVIARPYIGTPGNFTRTPRRHDFSLEPPQDTMLDLIKAAGLDVLSVGKIIDIFAGKGITDFVRTENNADGIEKTLAFMEKDFHGLCFTNLVDFDMLYGHRNDVDGYAKALSYFDEQLPRLLAAMRHEDLLMITADHGCDPATPSTDHSREYIPLVMTGKQIPSGMNYGTRQSFADISATILSYLGVPQAGTAGTPIM